MRSDKYRPAINAMRYSIGKSATKGERVLASLFPNRNFGYPGAWTGDRIEQVSHMRNWTYVAIDAIASILGQILPNLAYVRDQKIPGKTTKAAYIGQEHNINFGGRSFTTNYYYGAKALSVVKPHEELEPLENDHPLRRLLDNPNPIDTSFDLFYELDMFMELTGVGYLWAVPNSWGTPCELWVIPSHWVWPRNGGGKYVDPTNEGNEKLISYYEIRPWGGMGSAGMLKFPEEEVLRFSWKSPLNKIDGYSKLSAIAQWIDTEESIGKSRWAQFMNQALPSCAIELSEGYDDPDDAKIARIEAKFMAKLQGEYNVGRPFIGPAGAKITPLSFSPENMMYIASEEQIRDMILAAFRVPKTSVGLSESMTYGSILATLAQMCSFCINPRHAMLGLGMTKRLAPRFSTERDRVRIWWDDCTPPDPAQVNADIAQDYAAQAISPNEIRALRGRQPWKNGGDDPMIQGPGGCVPLPINTGDDLADLAALVPALGQQQQEEEQPGMEGGGGPAEEAFGGDLGIEEPNGKPSKQFKSYFEKTEGPHEFSSTQFNLPDDMAAQVLAWVNEHIAKEDLAGDGIETIPHVTIKYGLHTTDPNEVARLVSGFGRVEINWGGLSVFDSDEHDIVIVEVKDGDINLLNELLGTLDHTDTHSGYKPHLTLAYVQPGKGKGYAEALQNVMSLDGYVFDKFVFSSADGELTTIDLEKPVKRWRNRIAKESYFATCDRDDQGHCIAGSGGGSNGKTDEATLDTDIHAKADAIATKTVSKFKAALSKVKSAPVMKQVVAASNFMKDKTKQLYNGMEKRYGRKQAIAIFAAGHIVGLGTPLAVVPGSTILGMVPFAALAEAYLQAKRLAVGKSYEKDFAELTPEEINEIGEQLAKTLTDEYNQWLKDNQEAIEAAEQQSKGPVNRLKAVKFSTNGKAHSNASFS